MLGSVLISALAWSLPVQVAPPTPPELVDHFKPDPGWKPLGNAVWFDPARRELIIRARVALREGYLEHLLCLEQTKEHESILATVAPPRMIHAGLILVAGEPGHPVKFRPEFQSPTGPPIAIEARWEAEGKPQRADVRSWVKNETTGKALDVHWVFAGSVLFQDPETKKVVYAADSGDLFTVTNFPNAILDLPLESSSNDAERSFVAFTERIPPRNTPVTLVLRKVEPDPKSDAQTGNP